MEQQEKRPGLWIWKIMGIILLVLVTLRVMFPTGLGIEYREILRKLKAEGRPVTVAELKPAPVPVTENAAILYEQALVLMTTGTGGMPYGAGGGSGTLNEEVKYIEDTFSKYSWRRGIPWTGAEERTVSRTIRSPEMRRIYDLLEQASRKPACDFDLKYEDGPNMTFPHLSRMRTTARLLAAKAIVEAHSGNRPKALDTVLAGLKCSAHLAGEPLLISQLVRVATDGIMLDAMQEVARSGVIPREKTALLDKELASHASLVPWTRSLDGERVLYVGWLLEQKDISGAILRALGASGWMSSPDPNSLLWRAKLWLWLPFSQKDAAAHATVIGELQESLATPFYRKPTSDLEQRLSKLPKYCVLTRMLTPVLGRMREQMTRHHAHVGVCRAALALKTYRSAHGAYPKTLDALGPGTPKDVLTDVCSGKPLVYRPKGKGFVLYSVGTNMTDDGGTWGDPTAGVGLWDRDIVWEE